MEQDLIGEIWPNLNNRSASSPHMFEAGGVHDGEAALADHLGARPLNVAALVVAAKVVVVGRHLGGREHHKVWSGGGLVSLPQLIWMLYNENRILQGVPSGLRPGLGRLSFWLLHCLPNLIWKKWLGCRQHGGTSKFKVNITQVSHQMGHPVDNVGKVYKCTTPSWRCPLIRYWQYEYNRAEKPISNWPLLPQFHNHCEMNIHTTQHVECLTLKHCCTTIVLVTHECMYALCRYLVAFLRKMSNK